MQCYRGLRLGQGFRSRNGAFPSSTPPMESFQSRGQQLCKFIGTKESFDIRTEELNSHRIGSEQQNDSQCGSHALGSEIVGTARLRKRDHENQTGGSPLFPDHVVIFSRVFHLRVIAATIWEHGYQCGRRFLKWTRSIFTTREFKQRCFGATNVNRKLVFFRSHMTWCYQICTAKFSYSDRDDLVEIFWKSRPKIAKRALPVDRRC